MGGSVEVIRFGHPVLSRFAVVDEVSVDARRGASAVGIVAARRGLLLVVLVGGWVPLLLLVEGRDLFLAALRVGDELLLLAGQLAGGGVLLSAHVGLDPRVLV